MSAWGVFCICLSVTICLCMYLEYRLKNIEMELHNELMKVTNQKIDPYEDRYMEGK